MWYRTHSTEYYQNKFDCHGHVFARRIAHHLLFPNFITSLIENVRSNNVSPLWAENVSSHITHPRRHIRTHKGRRKRSERFRKAIIRICIITNFRRLYIRVFLILTIGFEDVARGEQTSARRGKRAFDMSQFRRKIPEQSRSQILLCGMGVDFDGGGGYTHARVYKIARVISFPVIWWICMSRIYCYMAAVSRLCQSAPCSISYGNNLFSY